MRTLLGAGDRLLNGGLDLTVILIVVVKTLITFGLLLVSVMLYIWFMRKVIADMQNRVGPDTAGPFGVLQSFADGVKLFFKEQITPTSADRRIYRFAPYLAFNLPGGGVGDLVDLGAAVTDLRVESQS